MQSTSTSHSSSFTFWDLVSYIFHPIFIPIYILWFLAFVHPTFFAGFNDWEKWRTIIISMINLVFFPLFTVLLLKGLGFIDSIFLRSGKDRIIPYIAFGIFSFWAYTVFKEQHHYPKEWSTCIFGVFLASSAGLIANIYTRVSMHAMGMGGWMTFFMLLAYGGNLQIPWVLALLALLTGLVCSARLITRSHTPFEIYLGLGIGFISQLVAWWYAFGF